MDPGVAQLLVLAFIVATGLSAVELKAALRPPVCLECPHCQAIIREERRREEAAREAVLRQYRPPDREDEPPDRSRRS
ncbi:MAG TPA: hypothetical protein VNJ28_02865 [Candidatus Limnocylindrales bacterium]|nr:hypothetical protein [Candidatus Limnocylindrales bacterium]